MTKEKSRPVLLRNLTEWTLPGSFNHELYISSKYPADEASKEGSAETGYPLSRRDRVVLKFLSDVWDEYTCWAVVKIFDAAGVKYPNIFLKICNLVLTLTLVMIYYDKSCLMVYMYSICKNHSTVHS